MNNKTIIRVLVFVFLLMLATGCANSKKENNYFETNDIVNEIVEETEKNVGFIQKEEIEDVEENQQQEELFEDNTSEIIVNLSTEEIELLSYALRNLRYVIYNDFSGSVEENCDADFIDSFMNSMTSFCDYDFMFDRFCELSNISPIDEENADGIREISVESYYKIMKFLTQNIEQYNIDSERLSKNGGVNIMFYTPTDSGEPYSRTSFVEANGNQIQVAFAMNLERGRWIFQK